ncbi:MAG: hypothetical protein PWQ29_1503 [Verrucomicrobiota bacterium]|jgi:hypothetical protein|nr:hypothetical protein [Verrucomicrobiota bacterium]MDK2964109.1 hypothetical protein [Verrucomicrobiota bacterium]
MNEAEEMLTQHIARIRCGEDLRFIVTSFENSGAKVLYETVRCERGTMELMIKDHKNGLRSHRTGGHKFSVNRFRCFCTLRPMSLCTICAVCS